NNLTVADQGNVSGSQIGSGVATFFPTIAADMAGNFVIDFAASGPNQFVGAYYALHTPADGAGVLETPGVLHAGLGTYVLTDSSGRDRWGDYTGIALDPTDQNSFWMFNEYSTADNRWATQVGELSVTRQEDFGLSGDFNGDGVSDVLWHNTDGTTSIW